MVWLIKYNNKLPVYLFTDYMIGISGILLISICIMDIPGLKKLMNNSIFSFLGKISYSLYLIHPIILLFMVYTFNNTNYNVLIFAILAVSVLLSWGYYMAIEEPSMKLGRYLSKKLRPNKGKEKIAA
jgi:peptidoglycan/LPS O-acetylase OafA/YrhL